jgi:ABC-2 type transport system permease protein
MIKMLHILKKEFLLITRDIHALSVLFVMPAVFILIMSLAMRDLFELHSGINIDVLTVNRDAGKMSGAFLKSMNELHTFRFHPIEKDAATEKVKERMISGDYKFALIIKEDFSSFVENKAKDEKPLTLLVNPTVNVQTRLVLKSALERRVVTLRWDAFIDRIGKLLNYAGIDKSKMKSSEESFVEIDYVYKGGRHFAMPSSVQQNVPAWLIFSMFFIVIPISNTFISEREQGTFMRLKSMNVSRFHLMLGKMVPYLLINAIQVMVMIAIGVYVVPLFGGAALAMGSSVGGLILISAFVSFSAISAALLIASIARTTEQATTIGGVMNIIFGALGGIMVPKFAMPGFMQDLANISPMSWGLEGFLDIFLRNGGASDVLPECLSLFIFGAIMLALTAIILRRQRYV